MSTYLKRHKKAQSIKGSRPKTDEDAQLKCVDCSYLIGQTACKILGEITVATRHQCFMSGYSMVKQTSYPFGSGKVYSDPGSE